MSKKKILLVALCMVCVAVLSVGATVAYFTAEDNKTNTFTVGNVAIEINEMQVNAEGKYVAYEDNLRLSPIAHSKTTFNKVVITENTGSEPAYIRTFVTCPTDMYWAMGLGFNQSDYTYTGIAGIDGTVYALDSWKDAGTFTIDGEETSVFVCEYTDPVAAKDAVMSLTKVWLYDTVTNENVTSWDLADGAFEVKVASEAIQSANLTYEEAMTKLGAIDQAKMDKLFN